VRKSGIQHLLPFLLLLSSALQAENKRQAAEELIQHAAQLSNIRSEGASAFKLEAELTFSPTASPTSGTYHETWVSAQRWQTETAASNLHRVELVDGKKRWQLTTGEANPDFDSLERITNLSFSHFAPDQLREQTISGVPVICSISKADAVGGKSALCFDQKTGLLAEVVIPRTLDGKIMDDSCVYSGYEAFAGKQFPHVVKCFHDGRPTMDAKLSLAPVVVSELPPFTPPVGAEESVNCLTTPQAPKPTYTPDPKYPAGQSGSVMVVLWLSLGIDGKPADMKVVSKANPAFDNLATEAVSRWRFHPAMCEGQPMKTTINVEVSFRKW